MKRIIVGLDGSARSPGVLAAAVNVGRAQGAKLTLLRSVGLPPDVPQDFWKTTEESLIDVLRRQARQNLEEHAKKVPAELLGGIETVIGVAWQVICDAVHMEQADLVVIGSHELLRLRPSAGHHGGEGGQPRGMLGARCPCCEPALEAEVTP